MILLLCYVLMFYSAYCIAKMEKITGDRMCYNNYSVGLVGYRDSRTETAQHCSKSVSVNSRGWIKKEVSLVFPL